MGFYGNITNTNKTQFTFDRTYSSRALMENRIKRDEIYLGRYVLVEYDADNNVTLDTFVKAYKNGDNFYTSPNFEQRTRLKMGDQPSEDGITVVLDQVIYVEESVTSSNGQNDLVNVFYICTDNGADGYAIFEPINTGDSNYATNYNIDKAVYGNNRGYDSTVWQKIYVNDKERFIMIAELNTRTPSFDLVVDAPTMTPIAPHFGTDSTNMDYKLHWQPQWGLRVGEAEANEDGKIFSDVKVKHIKSTYDPEKDETISTSTEVDGAIYYNAAGLNRDERNYDDNPNLTNYIKIEPTGSSGVDYLHGNGIDNNDIYEMKIHLPAIGNMVSSGWDALIGEDRLGDFTEDPKSISWLKKCLEEQIVAIKSLICGDKSNSVIMTSGTGVINGGLINGGTAVKPIVDILNEPLWSSDRVNVFAKDAWIYADFNDKEVEVQVPETNEDGTIKRDENGKVIYKKDENGNIIKEKTVQSEIVLYHNYTPFRNTKTKSNKQTGKSQDEIVGWWDGQSYSAQNLIPTKNTTDPTNVLELYTPYVDKAGHVVGHNIETVTLPHPGQLIKSDEVWIHQEMGKDEDNNLLKISHIQQDIETNIYNDEIQSFYVLANENIEIEEENAIQTKDNHITKVIKVKKDDFSLYWKGMTDN